MMKRMKIMVIKSRLLLVRTARLAKILCPKTDQILYIILIAIWMIFALLSNRVNSMHDGIDETYLRTLWNLRNAIFSSIVLAFVIGAFNHTNEYRKTLVRQHFLYVDAMDDFEELFNAVHKDDIWVKFHALYNDRCLEISLDFVRDFLDTMNIDSNEFIVALEVIQDRLEKIEYQLKNERLIVNDEEMMALDISGAKERISRLLLEDNKEQFEPLIRDLFFVLEDLRWLWRRDRKLDLQLLDLNERQDEDFYKRMWLHDFDIDRAREWL